MVKSGFPFSEMACPFSVRRGETYNIGEAASGEREAEGGVRVVGLSAEARERRGGLRCAHGARRRPRPAPCAWGRAKA